MVFPLLFDFSFFLTSIAEQFLATTKNFFEPSRGCKKKILEAFCFCFCVFFDCVDVSCCLPARISRVPHLRVQSCSLETNLFAVQTCLVSKFLRLVHCCRFHCFLSLWISTSLSPCLFLEVWAAACTNNQQLHVRAIRSFDTHLRSASALLSFHRNLHLSGFLFLSCHPSCPCRIFLCLSLSWRWRRSPSGLHRVCSG